MRRVIGSYDLYGVFEKFKNILSNFIVLLHFGRDSFLITIIVNARNSKFNAWRYHYYSLYFETRYCFEEYDVYRSQLRWSLVFDEFIRIELRIGLKIKRWSKWAKICTSVVATRRYVKVNRLAYVVKYDKQLHQMEKLLRLNF